MRDQNYPKDRYEIISVDDGSSDGTLNRLTDFIQENRDLNISALRFPRVIPRKAGDHRFRAGIARNLGAKQARGHWLAFLDADILTPPHYLNQLEKEHFPADVVQLKRYHLKNSIDTDGLFSDPEKLKRNCYIEEEKYWGAFYQKGFEGSHPPWKYVCTYGLSLSKKDFMDYGRFNTNFTGYGFEDTDLGYRLYKAKKKLRLSDILCCHQPPERSRREHGSFLKRHRQLSKTAKIFFYNHLDPDIYEHLTVYMKQERGLSYFFPGLRKPRFSQTLSLMFVPPFKRKRGRREHPQTGPGHFGLGFLRGRGAVHTGVDKTDKQGMGPGGFGLKFRMILHPHKPGMSF